MLGTEALFTKFGTTSDVAVGVSVVWYLELGHQCLLEIEATLSIHIVTRIVWSTTGREKR